MEFPKLNLHIHSNYSDGKQTINQIVKKSIKLKLDYIAITDHLTNSWKAWVSKLNNNLTISSYLDEISNCQAYIFNNNIKIVLLKGIEIDLSSTEQFIKKNINIGEFDLILFEYLQSYETIAYLENIIHYWKNQINNPLMFPILGLAHFDPSFFMLGNLDILMIFLKKHNIYFEFNSSYPSFYSPRYERFFEKIREYKIPVGIGCDSHHQETLNDYNEPLDMIRYYNLERNLELLINAINLRVKT
ncbi:MAG: PHP domain-containing protein [Candidatus Hermodarchaeota archaeon]